MTESSFGYLPTLQQLLGTEVMAEAQVLVGDSLNQRYVSQIISTLSPLSRVHSLLVTSADAIAPKDFPHLHGLAAIIVVGQGPQSHKDVTVAAGSASNHPLTAHTVTVEPSLARLVTICSEIHVPLIVLPAYGELVQIRDEIRNAFQKEMRNNANRLNSHFLKIVLTDGLEGLVEELSERISRPVVIETSNFQVLAARSMGATPPSQQQSVTEQVSQSLYKVKVNEKNGREPGEIAPIKVGRRLVLPVLLDEVAVGYISAMTKANDALDALAEFLQPATVAACVDFYQRRKDGAVFTVTQKSLLKDILSGRGLSAADQERLERHYGFDLCDGLLVFAVAITHGDSNRTVDIYDENLATTEVEGSRIFVVPYNHKDGKTWQQIAADLKEKIHKNLVQKVGAGAVRIQCGAARLAPNVLSLPEAYREARQALIIGNMTQGDAEFITGYGDLGIKRLLYLMIDHPELERFYEENLDPLESYDAEWESELLPSLRVYLEQGANLNSAARALFIHRHTLRYRLEQIEDILKVDITSQEVLLNLQIAFLIRDMKHGTEGKANL